jgi:hypothetical protein
MKKNNLLAIIILPVLSGCLEYVTWPGSEQHAIKDFLSRLEKETEGRYKLEEGVLSGKYYFVQEGNNIDKNSYLEVPPLPYGFYLVYENYQAFPVLNCLQNPSVVPMYSNLMIKEIFVYDDFIIMKIVHEDRYIKIFFFDPMKGSDVDMPDCGAKINYVFEEISPEFRSTHNLIS